MSEQLKIENTEMQQISDNNSAFSENGMSVAIDQQISEIAEFYLEDETPWVIGYSGGKDSTATLQVIWMALEKIEPEKRHKKIYVVTNDTLVENPIVQHWVKSSHERMNVAAAKQNLPIETHMLTPVVTETFWVNLIGRGYPAPNRRFRWCTERMKINPTTRFIRDLVNQTGEAIIVLGARKAESAARAGRIAKYEKNNVRENLSPHNDLPSALVYKPIVEWSNDDVWLFLMQYQNPWGFDNKDLLTMYRSATADEECPLVIDTSTPSCGNSRFGCWTCTVVEKDKSMSAMIQNSAEREWMLPLLELRNELAEAGKEIRDFRRLNGRVSIFNGESVSGPYTQNARAYWLKKVLNAQQWVRDHGPEEVRDIELITMNELEEIRRIWVIDKHEHEDLLPAIFRQETGEDLPKSNFADLFPFDSDDLGILKEESESDLQYELLRELVSLEHAHRSQNRRIGIFDSLDRAFDKSGWESPEEAINHMKAVTLANAETAEGHMAEYAEILNEIISKDVDDELIS